MVKIWEIHGNLATQLGQESPELQGLRQEHGFLQEALDTKEMVEFLGSLNANIFKNQHFDIYLEKLTIKYGPN